MLANNGKNNQRNRARNTLIFSAATPARASSAGAFALRLEGAEGASTVEFAVPPYFSGIDENEVGLIQFDWLGNVRAVWGIARHLPWVLGGQTVFQTPLARTAQEGGSLYLDGLRYYSPGFKGGKEPESYFIVFNALEEHKARRQAGIGWKAATTLKRLGRALTSNLTTQQICVAAIHELASTLELAAALVWVRSEDGFRLAASLGIRPRGVQKVELLAIGQAPRSLAEIVANTGKAYTLTDLSEAPVDEPFESDSCFLKVRGVCVLPLRIAGEVFGVLELVGRASDEIFEEHLDLFQTSSEHLALALNSAALYERAERTALIDSLTGIPNHRSLYSFLGTRFEEAVRNRQELAVIMVDVDHFRSFNEEEGHDAGDEVLRKVGQTLKASVRPYDMAARYGGEEFTLVLPSTNERGALRMAERARRAVEEIQYVSAGGAARSVTISLGCAVYPHAARTPEALLKAADTALYAAKRTGRNRVVLYEVQHGPEKAA